MRLRHKPLEYEVWQNVDKGEPMPDWVRAVAEPTARAGSTFLIDANSNSYGRRLIPAGYWVIQGPTDVYPCSPKALEAVFELEPIPPHVPSTSSAPDHKFSAPQPPVQKFGDKP